MEIKKEIAETFVPTVNYVKKFFKLLNEKVDTSMARGLLGFNNACKDVEALAMKELDDLKDAQAAAQVDRIHYAKRMLILPS